MLHSIGRVAMAIVEPGYLDFIAQCSKKGTPRLVQSFAEKKRYGVSHAVLGALICYGVDVFAPFARAILYHEEPYLLTTRKKDLHQLSAIVLLSSNIASQFKKVDKPDDPILAAWKGPELAQLKMTPAQIIQAIARVKT
jgi:hypothetical protein